MHDIAKIYRNADATKRLMQRAAGGERKWRLTLEIYKGNRNAAIAHLAHEYRAQQAWKQRTGDA